MGGLRPIGSEKLEGMDKIRRIMEIARYKENIPQPVNENKKNEFSLSMADGNTYAIVKEKTGYIIKKTITESENDYIEPIQERKYYSSYSQALKRLNLMAKEVNTLVGNKKGTFIFESEKKKLNETTYVLKTPELTTKTTTVATPAAAPTTPAAAPTTPATPAPAAAPTTPATPAPTGGEVSEQTPPTPEPAPQPTPDVPQEGQPIPQETGEVEPPIDGGEEGGNEMPTDEIPEPEGEEKKDEITFKTLQKLTGKLTQKIRKFNEEDQMSSKDTKYIINSILSSLELDSLEDDDIEEIIDRLESAEEEVDTEMDMDMEPSPEYEMTSSEAPPTPPSEEPAPAPEGEMAEMEDIDFMRDADRNWRERFSHSEEDEEDEDLDDFLRRKLRQRPTNSHYHLSHGTFGESMVDKVISKYFNINENEITIKEEENRKKLIENQNKNSKNIKTLSENVRQERFALKLIEKYPSAKMLGKLTNGALVFENKNIKYKVSIDGKLI